MKRRIGGINLVAFLGLALSSLLFPPGLSAADYPERPITIVVGFDPGAATDIMTRTMSAGAEKQLGKPFVIENKGGGGGSVALGIVANAKPDGYTLCAAPNVSMIDTALMQKVTFKPLKEFYPDRRAQRRRTYGPPG